MPKWSIGFLVGVIGLTFFTHLPSVRIAYLIIAISSILVSLILLQMISSCWILCFVTCSLGFSWALINAHHKLNQQLPKMLEGQTLIATGCIASIPEFHKHSLHFDFLINSIKTAIGINYPLHVHINGYFYKNSTKLAYVKKGDTWQFAIRLHRPRTFWNLGSFDYQAKLFQQSIQATGYIVDKLPFHLIQHASAYYFIDSLRQKLTSNVTNALENYPLRGLISALTTGIRYEITDKQWQVMRGTGTNHLFAISGLHLAFISGIIFYVVRFLWCRIPYAVLWIPASQLAIAFTLLLAVFYSALAGFAMPTQRALLMLSVFSLATLKRRHLTIWYSFNVALLFILIMEPFSVLSPSFWLSFMAVAFIFYAVAHRIKSIKSWRAWCRIQFTVGFGLIPLSLLFFHQISWLSFGANLLAIPWIGFVILPLSLLGSLMTLVNTIWGNHILVLAELLLEFLWKLLSFFSRIPWTQFYSSLSTPWLLFSSLLGFLILLAPKGIPARWLGLIWILPLFFWKAQGPKNADIWMHLLDVGQGLAIVLRTEHHVMIYDTGPRLSASFDAGKMVILPFLQKIGVQKIDMLMVSHGDNDHSGGAMIILQQIPVDIVLSSIPKIFLPTKANLCQEKTSWQWDNVKFEVLYPPMNQAYLGNNSSCVLKISNLEQSILLVGDIERIAENYLVNYADKNLASTILVVPHHGSKTSSSIEFLNHVQPKYALFSTGYHNRFKFPHKIVLNRYQRLHSKIYNTAVDGAIALKLNYLSNTIQIETYREKYQRFWQN